MLVRAAMPRQMAPREIRQSLNQLQIQPQATNETARRPAALLQQFARIVQNNGVRLDQLTPGAIERALTQSGLFHEARLAAGLPAQPADTKTALLQLLGLLRNEVKADSPHTRPSGLGEQAEQQRGNSADTLLNRLVRLVEGSISRIQLQQSVAVPPDDTQRQAYQIDLPIRLGDDSDDVMLRIERDRGAEDQAEKSPWAVNLAFQFDSIGTLQCRVALAGDRVSTTFWSEREQTHQLLERRLPNLRDALQAQGLEVVHLAGVIGRPQDTLIHVARPDGMLDERA